MAGPTPTRLHRAARAPVAAAFVCASLFSAGPALADDGDAKDKSAQELADAAKKELLDAKSLHLTMRNGADDKDTRTPALIDLRLDEDGNCTGELRMGTGGAKGGRVDLVKRGDEVWIKPDATFWKAQFPGRSGELAADLIGDRYVHGTTDDPMLDGLSGTCDLDSFRERLKDGSNRAAKDELTKGDQKKVAGTEVVPLTSTKSDDSKERTTLYVTADEPHRLVRATEKGSDESLSMTLTDYGKAVPKKTPSADDSIDVSDLRNTEPSQAPHAA
ncbi:LolA-like protein [Streptomyces sp. UC4497]